jgi:hypothetical protein
MKVGNSPGTGDQPAIISQVLFEAMIATIESVFLKRLQMPIPEHLQITPHNHDSSPPYPASRGESRASTVTNWRINQKISGVSSL